jgi:uncharacterized protein (TIGR03086 family)
MEGPLARAFEDAAYYLAAAVAGVRSDQFGDPGLGEWTVLELIAHANRGFTTVEDYLLHPVATESPQSPYFAPEAIAARGRASVELLGDDPAQVVADTAARVVALVADAEPHATIGSPVGTMALAAYLPSRVAELVIHGIDLTRATGATISPPLEAVHVSLGFVVERAVLRESGIEVLLALTGRGELPPAFSIY